MHFQNALQEVPRVLVQINVGRMKFNNNIIQLILPTEKFSVTPIIPAIHYLAILYELQITLRKKQTLKINDYQNMQRWIKVRRRKRMTSNKW